MQGNSHRFWELTGGNLWRTIILPPTEHNPTLSIMSQVGIRERRWQLKRKHLLETKGRGKVSSIIWTTGIRATVEGWKLSVLSTCSTPWQTQTNSSGLNQEGKLRQQGSSSRKKKDYIFSHHEQVWSGVWLWKERDRLASQTNTKLRYVMVTKCSNLVLSLNKLVSSCRHSCECKSMDES